jgi:uncharacterized protein YndB with AHSA1/START domain
MIRYSSEVTISRSPSEVFVALLDAKTYERWTDMTDTRFDTPGPPTVGTRGSFRMPGGPLKGRYEMEVVELEPDRRLVIHVSSPNLDWLSVTTLAPDGAGTRMTYAGEISLKGWMRVLEPVMAGEAQRGEAKEALRFKALLESEPGSAVEPGSPTSPVAS